MTSSMLPRLRVRACCTTLSLWIRPSFDTALIPIQQARYASTTSTTTAVKSPNGGRRVLQKDSRLFDESIPHRRITLVDPETSSLLPPARLSTILASLDRTRFSILLVDPSKEVPVCKIFDKKAEWDKKQAVKKQAQQSTSTQDVEGNKSKAKAKPAASAPPKEVHLTWGVTAHDLTHKLSKTKELLGKGSKVTVILKDKKGAERVSGATKDLVMNDVEQSIGGSGKCVKKGQRGGMWSMEFVPL